MKIITGQAPNLPWWRALDMSDEEIKAYNYKFMKETEMKDDSLSDVALFKKHLCSTCNETSIAQNVNLHNKCLNIKCKNYEGSENPVSVGKQFSPNKETNVYATKIWNEAIEAAAMCQGVDIFACQEIRKLKK